MSVYRPKGKDGTAKSPYWHYDFTFRGRRFSGSTGATKKSDAERIERQKREEAHRPRDDRSINGAFGLWWEEKGRHDAKSGTTFARLERLQDLLTEILEESDEEPVLAAIRTKHLTEYVARRRRQPRKVGRESMKFPEPATINRELQVLRRVMRYAVEVWELPLVLPTFSKAEAEEPAAKIRTIDDDTLAAILGGMREDYRDVFRWLLLCGARAGNAIATDTGRWLKPDNVDFASGVVSWRVKSKQPGGRNFELPLTDAMIELLERNLGAHPDAVFTYIAKKTSRGRLRGQRYPITYTAFYSEFKRAAAAAGVPHIRIHDLRHTAGTTILRTSGNLAMAQRLLGHTQITTTRVYAHVMTSDLRAAMEHAHESRNQNVPRKIPGGRRAKVAK